MRVEKTFKIDYKKLYDCTLYREKELLFNTLTKLSKTYKNIRIVLDKPNTEIYRIETF